LRHRHAVAVGDLAAWRWNIKHESAREFLCLESRDNCLLFRRSAWTGSRHWHERLCVRDRREGKQPKRYPEVPQILAVSSASHSSSPNQSLLSHANSRDLLVLLGIPPLRFASVGMTANFGDTADKSMPLQKAVHFIRQLSANAFGRCDLVDACPAEPIHGAELL